MQIGPRYKICKRLGSGVFVKCQTQKFELSKSKGGRRRRRRVSKYGQQLLEKQKARYTYGIKESKFKRYVENSLNQRSGSPTVNLYQNLESRLDNVVFRLGLAESRPMARQLVVHGHITVNDQRVTVPSYSVTEGDAVAVRKQSQEKGPFLQLEERTKNYTPPAWLSFDPNKKLGKIEGSPTFDQSKETFDLTSIIEFYSR